MIRLARPDDVPTIADLIRQLARYERLEHEVSLTEHDLAEHLFSGRRHDGTQAASPLRGQPLAEVLLAEDAGAVIGFALFFHNYSTFLARPGLYLEDLFVVPEHRRHGWGRALLVAVAGIAVERGCGRFEWAVLQWNEPAIAFYRALGAVLMDEWRICRVTGDALGRLAAKGVEATADVESDGRDG